MADIFDQVATQEAPKQDIFDQISSPKASVQEDHPKDIFDQISQGDSSAVKTPPQEPEKSLEQANAPVLSPDSTEEISQGPARTPWDNVKDFFLGKNSDEDKAKAANIYAIAKANNLDPSYVEKNYDSLSKNSKMTGLTPDLAAPKDQGQTLVDYSKMMMGAASPFLVEGAVMNPAATAAMLMAPTALEATKKAGTAAADLVTGTKPGTVNPDANDSSTMKQIKQVGDLALDTAVSVAAGGIASQGMKALTGKVTDSLVDNITQSIYDHFQPNMDSIKAAYKDAYGSEPTPADIKSEIRDRVMKSGASDKSVPELLSALQKAKGGAVQFPQAPPDALPGPETPKSSVETPNTPSPSIGPVTPEIVDPSTPETKLVEPTIQPLDPALKGLPYETLSQAHDKETSSIIADKALTKPEVEQVVQYWQSLSPEQAAKPSNPTGDATAQGDNSGPGGLQSPQKASGVNLKSEAGSAQLPGVDEAATVIKDGMDYVNRSMKMSPVANDIGYNLENLRTQKVADELGSKQLLTSADISPKDSEAIYHHVENPQEPLTPEQQQAYEKYIKPISDARNQLFSKLRNNGLPVDSEGYTPRYPVDKGNALDRLQQGSKTVGQGSLLNKSTGQFKHRTMKVITDDKGNRMVASIKGGEVIGFKNNVKQDLGKINLKSYEDIMKKELSPYENEARRLEKEQDILTATKGRYLAAESRIDGIHNQLSQIYDKINEIYSKHSYVNGEFRDLNGRVFQDKNGKTWNIGEATTKEIEAHTNIKYHKNILLNELLSYNKLRSIDRATTFLENLKGRPDFNKIGVKFTEGGSVPENWRPINMPQFRGYAFEPRVADTLDKFYGELKSTDNADGILSKINDFMTTSIFFNPLIHIPNIANHWAVNRGAGKWFVPKAYVTLAKTSARAIDAVIHQNDDYLKMLDSGANLLYHNVAGPGWGNFAVGGAKKLSDLMLEKMGEELDKDEQLRADVAKALGYANPLNLVKALYEFSGKATWMTNDVATMQAVYEEMAHGLSMEDAIKNVGKHIPDYRLPARVLDNKKLADIMGDRSITMFSRYHYGALKSYGEMIKDLLSKNSSIKDRVKSLDHLLMLGLVTLVLYTQLDKLAKMLTGNKNAMVRRAGGSTVPYNTARLLKQKIDIADYLFAILTPAPLLKFGAEEVLNKDVRTGRSIRRPGTEGEDVLKHAAATISPLSYYQRLEAGDMTPDKFGQQLVGISTPKNANFTDAEQFAANINKSKGFGGAMTDEQIKQFRVKQQLAADYNKTEDESILDKAIDKGTITERDKTAIVDKSNKSPLEIMTTHMAYSDIENILKHGHPTAQEKEALVNIFIDKIDRKIDSLPSNSDKQKALENFKKQTIDKFK